MIGRTTKDAYPGFDAPGLATQLDTPKSHSSWALLEGSGQSLQHAWRAAEGIWTLVRASVELSAASSFTLVFGSIGPRGVLAPPSAVLVQPEGDAWRSESLRYVYPADLWTAKPVPFGSVAKGNVQFLAERVSNDEQDSGAVLFDVLRLYLQAIEQPYDYACLLHLWQAAESVTLSESSRGDTNAVAKRLAMITEARHPPLSGVADFYRSLGKARNDIVHRGIHAPIADNTLETFRWLMSDAITWLVHATKRLKTRQHLEALFRRYGQSKEDRKVFDDVDAAYSEIMAAHPQYSR